jgi:hypothetical protein
MMLSRVRRWIRRRGCVAALGSALSVVLFGACDASNAVVGGSCAPGYTECDGQCVELSNDPRNCGSCGHVCASGACVAGSCGGRIDASADATVDATPDSARRDAPTKDGPTRDGGDATALDAFREDGTPGDGRPGDAPGDGRPGDGTPGDGAPGDGKPGDAMPLDGMSDARDGSADQCAPPYSTTASCGACGASCMTGQVCAPVPDGGLDAGVYSCAPACPPPLTACDGTCVDETVDPENCGACDRVCPSGICIAGVCAGSALGDIVIIGHDYASPNVRVSERTLLANAVFLPPTNPLRVLSFEQYAAAPQVTNVKNVLKQAATASGRQIAFTPVTDYTLVPADLASTSYDVLLVYDQPNAPAASLTMVGTTWQNSLGNFIALGGDAVILDGASGANPQMTDLLSASALLQTTAEVHVAAGTQLYVVASGDAVGNFVVSPYAAQADTVSFVTSEANGGNIAYVVDDGSDAAAVPVVIHKIP